MIETPLSPSTASRPLGRAPTSMHAGLGPAVLVLRGQRLPHADERVRDLALGRPLPFPCDPPPDRGTMRRAKEQVADLGARLAPRIRIGFPLLVGIQPFKILVRILQRVSRFRATGLGEALAPQVLLRVGVPVQICVNVSAMNTALRRSKSARPWRFWRAP